VAEHLQVFRHVGLLVNGPPGPHQTGRAALYLVIRLLLTSEALATLPPQYDSLYQAEPGKEGRLRFRTAPIVVTLFNPVGFLFDYSDQAHCDIGEFAGRIAKHSRTGRREDKKCKLRLTSAP